MESLRAGEEFVVTGFKEVNPVVEKVKSMGLREGKRVKVLMKNGRVYLLKLDNTRLVVDENVMNLLKYRS
ncbi:MAG: hypothetical protein GXN96_01795 [Aquificae bacterium]|nr:hypothetical protein [Aquificota bacterium]